MITGSTQIDFGVASTCETKQGNNEWTSSSKDFSVQWTLDPAKTEITFTVTGSTAGWVGFGISTKPAMTNCDMYVGWYANNQLTLVDSWASGQSQPSPDTTNSITNPTGSEVTIVTIYNSNSNRLVELLPFRSLVSSILGIPKIKSSQTPHFMYYMLSLLLMALHLLLTINIKLLELAKSIFSLAMLQRLVEVKLQEEM